MSKRTQVQGYIVLILPGWPAFEDDGVLYGTGYRNPATIYPSRRVAQRRIDSTVAWAKAQGLDWDRGDYTITRVRGSLPPSCVTPEDTDGK